MTQRKRPAPPQNRPIRNHINASESSVRCRRCRRPLRAVLSVSRQRGPVCWRKCRVAEAVAA
ncbi:DUF6011 domain-containing protein [Mycobacterium asiaticum]|uniref:DUF6011 domain-containing protein n=1 Tax=Mycobacterium asiaticum TaxID=1790 RepID=UPI003461E584